MRKQKKSNLIVHEVSNNSTAEIIFSTIQHFQCKVCKLIDSYDELIEVCQCDEMVHEQCMKEEINRWMNDEELGHSQGDLSNSQIQNRKESLKKNNNGNGKSSLQQQNSIQNQKSYICSKCHKQVFYKAANSVSCKTCKQLCCQLCQRPVKSFFVLLLFIAGLSLFILSILFKLGFVPLCVEMNSITLSVITIAVIIVSGVTSLVAFYFIFVDYLTENKLLVQKLYSKAKRSKKPSVSSMAIIDIV